jgi:hypothetical protein
MTNKEIMTMKRLVASARAAAQAKLAPVLCGKTIYDLFEAIDDDELIKFVIALQLLSSPPRRRTRRTYHHPAANGAAR